MLFCLPLRRLVLSGVGPPCTPPGSWGGSEHLSQRVGRSGRVRVFRLVTRNASSTVGGFRRILVGMRFCYSPHRCLLPAVLQVPVLMLVDPVAASGLQPWLHNSVARGSMRRARCVAPAAGGAAAAEAAAVAAVAADVVAAVAAAAAAFAAAVVSGVMAAGFHTAPRAGRRALLRCRWRKWHKMLCSIRTAPPPPALVSRARGWGAARVKGLVSIAVW